jgi:D-alanyl-D-alanine dipeptidase
MILIFILWTSSASLQHVYSMNYNDDKEQCYVPSLIMHISNLAMTNKDTLPAEFLPVTDIHPDIRISPRYALSENFIGRPFVGYDAPILFLTQQAGEALKAIQDDVAKDGFDLVIYDAYRPQRTVDSFMAWAHDLTDQVMKDAYYPRLHKKNVFEKGFIAKRSSHSRGSTLDLTIIEKSKDVVLPSNRIKRTLHDDFTFTFLDDGTVDMGSHFDLFDEASFHDSPLVSGTAQNNRNYLRAVMIRRAFSPYAKEWWHYTLQNEPYTDTYFDFPFKNYT